MPESYKEGGLIPHKYVIHKARILGFLEGEFDPCDTCTPEELEAINRQRVPLGDAFATEPCLIHRLPVFQPIDPSAKYFVMRYDKDPNALIATLIYAMAVSHDNPVLCDDLIRALRQTFKCDFKLIQSVIHRLADMEMTSLLGVLIEEEPE